MMPAVRAAALVALSGMALGWTGATAARAQNLTMAVGAPVHPRCPHAMERCRTERPPLRGIAPGHRSACHLKDGAPA